MRLPKTSKLLKLDLEYNMAFHYSPKVPTEGVKLVLDSYNQKSYPGSGNTWYDLSGNDNHGTLTNFTGAGSSTTSGFNTTTKNMMFDKHVTSGYGSGNNYISVSNSNSLDEVLCQNGMSIVMWLRMDTYDCTALTKWNGSWEIYYCANLVFRTQGTGGNDGNSGYSYTNELNNFHSIIATHDGTTRKLFVNGVQRMSNSNSMSGQNTSNSIGIGGYHGGAYAFQGALSYYSLYNRALDVSEIDQTHNALKTRFGI